MTLQEPIIHINKQAKISYYNILRSETFSRFIDSMLSRDQQTLNETKDKSSQNAQNAQQDPQEEDEIDYYADDTPLPRSKPFDLKALWIGQTDKMLQKFNKKFNELKTEQEGLQEGFRIFAENEHKYKLSSLRKIEIKLDRKKLYDQYMLKSRKTIEKINPALFLNIMSYTNENLFLALYKMRRVSKIFNEIYSNQEIQEFLAEKDYLYSDSPQKVIKSSVIMCRRYVNFSKTFQYYKQMQYTEQIPQNSIIKDFEYAVNFINDMHKLVIQRNSRDFTYYEMMNNFMKKHRVVIGLSSLSLTSLVMVRKAAIIAFSNYLALNQQERSKEQITKTKYSKVINVVQYEDYRDSLIINTKVSNYLWDYHKQNFAVLVTSNMGKKPDEKMVKTWNILVYHVHNEQKAEYLEDVKLKDHKYMSTTLDLEFKEEMAVCKLSTIEYSNWVQIEANGKCMDIITSPLHASNQQDQLTHEIFSYCLFYRYEQYYVIAVPNQFA